MRNSLKHSPVVSLGEMLNRGLPALKSLAFLAIFLMCIYIPLRISKFDKELNWFAFWVVLLAEIFGFLIFILFISDTWKKLPISTNHSLTATVDVFLTTYNEPASVLEPSILAASEIDGLVTVHVLDDGNRSWVKELCSNYNVNYIARKNHDNAKAGNINHALSITNGEFIAVFDADHVANPQFAQKLLGYFHNERVAIVQTPHYFRNSDSFQHLDVDVNEQSLFYEVLMPSRDRFGAVFWCGSAALIRRSALVDIGGVATSTITEDFETSLKLAAKGYITKWHDEVLVAGLAPGTLDGYLVQRDRWAKGTLYLLKSKISPFRQNGISTRAKISYIGNLLYYFLPIQHLIFTSFLTLSLFTDSLVFVRPDLYQFTLWSSIQALMAFVTLGMSRGRQTPFTGVENSWLTSWIYIKALAQTPFKRETKFKVTPKVGLSKGGLSDLQILWLPTTVALFLVLAMSKALVFDFSNNYGSNSELTKAHQLTVLLFIIYGVFELATIILALVRVTTRRQRRAEWRYPVSIPAEVLSVEAEVVDMHENGIRLKLKSMTESVSKSLNEVPVVIKITDTDGQMKLLHLTITKPRFFYAGNERCWYISGPITWQSKFDRSIVIRYLYVPRKRT